MIKIRNHLGTIVISKKYLVKLVTEQVESCFGIAGLNNVEIMQTGNGLSIKLSVDAAVDVNIPAVADAVSHKVSYVLTNKTGADVRSVELFVDRVV
jgi:uncharacterized alkaline shock family protein YloU